MSTPTATEVKEFAPEFTSLTDARVDLFIGLASDYVSQTQFGKKEKQALLLVTCHLLKMTPVDGQFLGDVTSEKVGELQVSYGPAGTKADDEWDQTQYGQQFAALKRTIKRTPLVV